MLTHRAFLVALLLALTLAGAGTAALAQQNIQVSLDGAALTFAQPLLMYDMTYPLLPAEPFLQALGANVTWDPATARLDIALPGVSVQMVVGSTWVLANGQRETLEVGLQTLSGVPYVPGAQTARLLGFDATWTPETLNLAISTPITTEVAVTATATLLAPPGDEVPVVLRIRGVESGRVREVALDPQARIQRGTEPPLARADVEDLEPGDLLELGLNRQGVAVTVNATYRQEIGTVTAVQGNQLALNDGRTFPLGEGITAVGSDGTPLHVLGTVGEVAILRLNPRTNEVWGILSQRRGNPTPPATAQPVIAGFFLPGYARPLGVGARLDLRILGSAGAQAEVILPWRATRVALSEVNPGEYVASYEIPAGMEIARSPLTARLTAAGGLSATALSTIEVIVDTAAPTITDLTPEPDGTVGPMQPRISVSFRDQGPSGLDAASAAIALDGRDATPRAQVSQTGLVRIPERLEPGRHSARVEVSDYAGNTAVVSWEFVVQAEGPQILAVDHDAAGPLHPGDILTVSATVATPGQVRFDIEGVVAGVPMQLQPEGNVYRGTYEVQEGDLAENAAVTVHLRDAADNVHSLAADVGVTIEPAPVAQQVTITFPSDGAQTGRRIVPAGTGPPGGRVQWIITYQKAILAGEVARGTVTVAADGTWQAGREVDLKLFLVGMADRYGLTAQLLGADDAVVSEAAVAFTARD